MITTLNRDSMAEFYDKRFVFINHIVCWEGQINTTHISEKFQITRQAASHLLKKYRETYPDYLCYDSSLKAFLATEIFNQNIAENNVVHSFPQYLSEISNTPNSSQLSNTFVFEVEAPLRNINPITIRPILHAIRNKLAIDIGYISLSSPDYLDRIIQPHALIFDGLRWHVRAYCNKNQAFRDFTLSRFNGDAIIEGKATQTAEHDETWNTFVDVIIEADPRFSEQQKRIIEQDFQMHHGKKVITTRAALVNYLLRRLHIDVFKNTPEEQQIVLTPASRKQITPYLVKPV